MWKEGALKVYDSLRKWLIDRVNGVEIDGMVITYPWLSYERALQCYNEITK